ncbi:MAG: AtpZ/AtpI family protein [Flammeovirgaceae bacterium]|jgi:F0F1-type ATP synthase assembly protein I|nr:AtpZ/AtpI family protein [Flammeovirgaceae bacterium]
MNENRKQPTSLLKYSSLGVQMVVTLGVGAWLGQKLDHYFNFKFPVFLITFVFLLFGGLMVQLYRTLNKD